MTPVTQLDHALVLVRARLHHGGGIAAYADLIVPHGTLSPLTLGHAVARMISRAEVDWHPRTRMIVVREQHRDDTAAEEEAAMLPP